MQETPLIPGGEDPLEKETATHSSILAWRIPWTEAPGRATVHGLTESDTSEHAPTTEVFWHPPKTCVDVSAC